MSHLDRQAQTKLHSKHVRFSDQQLVFALSNLMNILNTLTTLAVDFVLRPQFFQFSLLTHSDHIKLLYYMYVCVYNPLWKLGTAPAILDLLNRSQKTMERPLAVSSTQMPSMSGRGLQQPCSSIIPNNTRINDNVPLQRSPFSDVQKESADLWYKCNGALRQCSFERCAQAI